MSASRRGYTESEIQAAFKKYDVDGDKVLDEEEQKRMQEDLEGQRVSWTLLTSVKQS